MTFESTHALVEEVAQAVHALRITLENHELPGLEAAILNSQMALKGLENHPGGVDGLKQLIATYSDAQQKQLNDRLAQARAACWSRWAMRLGVKASLNPSWAKTPGSRWRPRPK